VVNSENILYQKYMTIAIEEAKKSFREGNKGFGAVIIRDDEILSAAHDTEETECDPSAHAEMTAIRIASKIYGKNLQNCILISTHEPCSMCASCIIWSGISTVVYGYSIHDAIMEGRKRINITCREIFNRAESKIKIIEGLMKQECSVLYKKSVRNEIKKLRAATEDNMTGLNNEIENKRLKWYDDNAGRFNFNKQDLLIAGYELLMKKLNILSNEAPVMEKSAEKILFHSKNFCPTLEACKILDLDTRIICKNIYEKSTDALLKRLDENLKFERNYDKIRPFCEYCEEMIYLKDNCHSK
jgi:tRNA(adenine34) deaminase